MESKPLKFKIMATRTEQNKDEKELVQTMLKRANLKEKDIYDRALKVWISKNLDLLTKDELKKYKEKGLLLI